MRSFLVPAVHTHATTARDLERDDGEQPKIDSDVKKEQPIPMVAQCPKEARENHF
jgi:hypothetical protein